jgi:hypothetical protein
MISPAEVEIQVWKIGIEPHKKMWFNRRNRNLNSKKGFQLSTSFNQRQYGYAEGDSIQILGQLGATTRTEFPCQTDLLGFLSEHSMPGHITYIWGYFGMRATYIHPCFCKRECHDARMTNQNGGCSLIEPIAIEEVQATEAWGNGDCFRS